MSRCTRCRVEAFACTVNALRALDVVGRSFGLVVMDGPLPRSLRSPFIVRLGVA